MRVEVVAITRWEGKKKTEEVVPGRSFEDCDPVSGDRPSHSVTWRGQSDLGVADDVPIRFRFRLRAARLYAFEVLPPA